MAFDINDLQGMGQQVPLGLESQRVRHLPLDIVDGSVERPERSFAHGMDACRVGYLIDAAHDAVQNKLEPEIRNQHRVTDLCASRLFAGASSRPTLIASRHCYQLLKRSASAAGDQAASSRMMR
jgi:hypothetical protein